MREGRRVRLIRKSQPQAEPEKSATEAPKRKEASEREIKTTVSRWVSEHRQRSEEFRLTFLAMLKGGGFQLPSR